MLDRIFPCLVLVVVKLCIKIASVQYLRRVITLLDDGVHRALEAELHVLRQIIFEIHLPVPGKVLTERQVHALRRRACQVTHLHVTKRTVHVRVERPTLRQVIHVHLLEELHLAHFLHFAERLQGFGVEVIRILERPPVIGRQVLLQLRRVLVLLIVRSRDTEVSRVVEHILLLTVDIDLQVTYRKGRTLVYRVRQLLDRVALLLRVVRVQCLFEFDIRI